jgi:anti-sigma factor RsiW
MTQYVGCDHARDLLDGLIDGELSMAEQLAVESHLRWCRTCTLRLEDMRLIGASLRMGAAGGGPGRTPEESRVAAINEAVLARVRAEHEQSFGFRLREMFADMRLLWPALGATAAVAVCVGVAATVMQASTATQPESLAALIATLANPGSENNPMRPVNTRDPLRDQQIGVSIPRLTVDDAMRAGGMLDALPEEDVIYTIRTVVGRDGRVTNFEVLLDGEPKARGRAIDHVGHQRAVLDALQQSRFVPAKTPLGQAVAVDMVWVIAKTTAVVEPSGAPGPALASPAGDKSGPKPALAEPADPVNQRSATIRRSTTA